MNKPRGVKALAVPVSSPQTAVSPNSLPLRIIPPSKTAVISFGPAKHRLCDSLANQPVFLLAWHLSKHDVVGRHLSARLVEALQKAGCVVLSVSPTSFFLVSPVPLKTWHPDWSLLMLRLLAPRSTFMTAPVSGFFMFPGCRIPGTIYDSDTHTLSLRPIAAPASLHPNA